MYLTRYVALAKARRDPSTLDVAALGLKPLVKRRTKKWSPLEHIHIPPRKASDGKATLDGTLDLLAYQLFRDNLLPPVVKGIATVKRQSTLEKIEARVAELQKEAISSLEQRVEMDMAESRGGVQLRRSIGETAVVIGCDEAGRGPLAGPVIGAAVCRIPRQSYENGTTVGLCTPQEKTEAFSVADSKRMKANQRMTNFKRLTGCANIFDIANSSSARARAPYWGGKAEPNFDRVSDLPRSSATILLDATVASRPSMICWRGVHGDAAYRYYWAITVANHAFVDKENIFASSMSCMNFAARSVWNELEQPLPGPSDAAGTLSTSQLLYHRYAHLAPFDDEAALLKELQFPAPDRDNVFGPSARQPPLVLVDGSHVPAAATDFFGDVEVGGGVHHVVKGDARSWSIAAASNLAKCCRDDVMDVLHAQFPEYRFDAHRGYPVAEHLRLLKKHGLSPVHRLSYNPCSSMVASAAALQ